MLTLNVSGMAALRGNEGCVGSGLLPLNFLVDEDIGALSALIIKEISSSVSSLYSPIPTS